MRRIPPTGWRVYEAFAYSGAKMWAWGPAEYPIYPKWMNGEPSHYCGTLDSDMARTRNHAVKKLRAHLRKLGLWGAPRCAVDVDLLRWRAAQSRWLIEKGFR
jgi:hypothetical protein